MKALVGHTGFVGTNLKNQSDFDALYNSTNIEEISDRTYSIAVCCAAPATMWAANKNPDEDWANIQYLTDCLSKARIGKLVMISTIAVFDKPDSGYNEFSDHFETEKPYGRHRRALEEAAYELAEEVYIVRLPALFGEGLKKNFVYDLINPIPSFLTTEKFNSLIGQTDIDRKPFFTEVYQYDDTVEMMRRSDSSSKEALISLRAVLEQIGFTSANFTNSNNCFQYFDIRCIWPVIERVIELDINVLNVCSEPLRAGDICASLTGREFVNEGPPLYREDIHSDFSRQWDGPSPYLYSATETLANLKMFYDTEVGKKWT